MIIIIIIIIINDSIYPAVSKASRTGNKVSCQPNDCPNRWVFKRRLKMASDGAETMSAGRSFQTRGTLGATAGLLVSSFVGRPLHMAWVRLRRLSVTCV